MRKDGWTSPFQVIFKKYFKNTCMKHPHNRNTHHMSSPQINTAKMPMTRSPQMNPPQSPRKRSRESKAWWQHPFLRSQCGLHIPGRPQLHCDTTDKRHQQHPEKNGRFVRLRSDTSRLKDTVQSIINDYPNPYRCIIFIRTKGSKPRRYCLGWLP